MQEVLGEGMSARAGEGLLGRRGVLAPERDERRGDRGVAALRLEPARRREPIHFLRSEPFPPYLPGALAFLPVDDVPDLHGDPPSPTPPTVPSAGLLRQAERDLLADERLGAAPGGDPSVAEDLRDASGGAEALGHRGVLPVAGGGRGERARPLVVAPLDEALDRGDRLGEVARRLGVAPAAARAPVPPRSPARAPAPRPSPAPAPPPWRARPPAPAVRAGSRPPPGAGPPPAAARRAPRRRRAPPEALPRAAAGAVPRA